MRTWSFVEGPDPTCMSPHATHTLTREEGLAGAQPGARNAAVAVRVELAHRGRDANGWPEHPGAGQGAAPRRCRGGLDVKAVDAVRTRDVEVVAVAWQYASVKTSASIGRSATG